MRPGLARSLLSAATVGCLVAIAQVASSGRFEGSDTQAVRVAESLDPDYQRWLEPVWAPPNAVSEAALFGLQAAAGTLLLLSAWARLGMRT
jgi:cobalt transport protein